MDRFINSLLRDIDDELLQAGVGPLPKLTREGLACALYETVLSRRVEIVGLEVDEAVKKVGVTIAIKLPPVFTMTAVVTGGDKETAS